MSPPENHKKTRQLKPVRVLRCGDFPPIYVRTPKSDNTTKSIKTIECVDIKNWHHDCLRDGKQRQSLKKRARRMENNQNFVEAQVAKFALMILGYLKKNPNAMDTLEGITEWWILSENIHLNLTKVQNALDNLLAEDLIQKKNYNGQKIYYQLNKDKVKDIDKLYDSNLRVFLDHDFSNN